MTTTERRGRPAYRARLAEQTGLDQEALTVLYDEYGNRRRFEVLGGRLVEQPIMERSSHYSERMGLLYHLKAQNPRNEVGSPCAVRLPDGELYAGDVVVWRPETVMVGEPEHTDGYHGVPDLFVEVVATGKAAQDAEEKRRHCAACGVPHFWVADLRRGSYVLYAHPEGEDYVEQNVVHDRAGLGLPAALA
ncbi:MAG: Uma2 family endonuclease [Chloroflexota bacterium]